MKNGDRIFRIGVSFASMVEICMLWGLILSALGEYDPTHVETIGIAISVLMAAVASSVFLVLLFYIIRWKV